MQFPDALLQEIGKRFIDSKEKIAVAESVTSGYLQNAFSQMENASLFFNGGITAYTPEIKIKLLNVDAEEAEKEDCVSPNITETMAKSIAGLFETECSVAITGYATPVEESGYELFAYYSIYRSGQILLTEKINLPSQTKSLEAQHIYVNKVLEDLKNVLK